jgi:L-asparaginase II
MTDGANPVLAEWTRGGTDRGGAGGPLVERAHRGAVAVADPTGALVWAAGDVGRPVLPRSSIKLLQALPLVESGAADARRLDSRRLALACASHQGSAAHAGAVAEWLADLGLGEPCLMCGAQIPSDGPTRAALKAAGEKPSQLHNNCSGKHAGFVTLALHLGAGPEGYVEIDHPVQKAAAEAFAEATGQDGPLSWGVDGCSAPNFAAPLSGIAAAMARAARPEQGWRGVRARAAARLRDAMAAHPFEVAGTGRACTELMEAAEGRAVVKTGADGAFTAILTERGLGVALKIDDGDGAAAECAMAALLARYGAVDPADPRVARRLSPVIENRRGLNVGDVRATAALTGP